MAQGVKIGGGYVDIAADMKNFDNAMNALPKKAAAKMDAAMTALQASLARNKLDLKLAIKGGDAAVIKQLTDEQERLRDKIDSVTHAATSQATAIQNAAKASIQAATAARDQTAAEAKAADEANKHAAAMMAVQQAQIAAARAAAQSQAQAAAAHGGIAGSVVPGGPRDQRAVELIDYSTWTKKGRIDFEALGATGQKAGQQIRQGAGTAAMGLMLLSQAIDDAQYGFRAIVNNIPMLTTAIGQGLGMSTEAAFKLGGALGIAAVAVNTWVSHWEDVKAIFAGDWTNGAASTIRGISDALLTGAASIVNFARGLGTISLTTADLALNQKGLADRAAQKAANEKATEGAESAVSGVRDQEAEARGALFREQLKKYGGGEKLRNEMLPGVEDQYTNAARFRVKNNPNLVLADELEKARKTARDSVNLEIEAAMKGNPDAMDRIAKVHPELPSGQGNLAQEALEQKGRENERAFRRNENADIDALNKQGREAEAAMHEARVRERDQESSRFANALEPRLSKDILKPGGIGEGDLEAKVKEALEKAGVAAEDIGKLVKETAQKLRKNVEERVREKTLGGLTQEQAQAQVAMEDREKQRGLRGESRAGVQSDQSFYASMLAPSSAPDNIPKEQLEVQKEIAGGIKEVAKALDGQKRGPEVARAAPKGVK